MDHSTRKPAHKKRHTKPCKFFQTMNCPYSAEDCAFAHVLATNEPVYQNAKLCRYYNAGHCSNSLWCRYKHTADSFIAGHDDYDGYSFTDIRDMEQPPNRSYQNFGRDRLSDEAPSVFIPSTQIPFHNMYMPSPGWPMYSENAHYSQNLRPSLLSSSHSGDSSTSQTTSPRSSILSDDVIVITEDPHYAEHSHSHQSKLYVTEDSQPVHVSPFYVPGIVHSPVVSVAPAYPTATAMLSPTYGDKPSASPSLSARSSRPQSRPTSRNKLAHYKTKPCKFYRADATCPSGDSCTFLHDEPIKIAVIKNETHGLPPKPVTVKEQNLKKGYFPVSWRVIGGGVLMGGGKDHKNVPSSINSGHDFDHVAGYSNSVYEGVSFPSIGRENTTPPQNVASRPRATSIPPTPSAHLKREKLFSAESPGGL